MTQNQTKFEQISKPIFRKTKKPLTHSFFQWRVEDGEYTLSQLGIENGFLSIFGKVKYYIPETDKFVITRKIFW